VREIYGADEELNEAATSTSLEMTGTGRPEDRASAAAE